MILSSEVATSDVNQMLEFYKQHFAVVELVSCMVCGANLAFECSGGMDTMGLMPNEIGKCIIPIGDALQSTRVRLDEAPTGERMMGYQCGNLIPNDAYPAALKKYEAELAEYQEEHRNKVARAKKAHAKAVAQAEKQKHDPPEFIEPAYYPPAKPSIPEFIECGNDTRIADVERGKVPVGRMQTALSPFEKHKIAEEIKKDRSYKPNFKKHGLVKQFETFKVERIM